MLGVATFTLYLPDNVLARLDEVRGSTSRSAFIRAQLEQVMPMGTTAVGGMIAPTPAQLEQPLPPVQSRSEMFARATQNRP
jgi:hypothetical protein